MRYWPAMLLGLGVAWAPLFTGMLLGFTGRWPQEPGAEAMLAIGVLSLVFAFAAGCIVSWIARVPLAVLDYALAAALVIGISANRVLKAPDPGQTVFFLALSFLTALAGAWLAERARDLG